MVYRFGTFEFDVETSELRKNGRAVALEPQPARALALLLARAGQTVTRDELKDAVWGRDTHVDFDRGLAYCLSQVRSALGDKGDNPRFVQTLPRKGYSFIAPVDTGALGAAPASVEPAPTQPLARQLATWLPVVLVVLIAVAIGGWALVQRRAAPRVVVAVSVFDNETGDPQYDRLVAGLSDLVVTRLTTLAPSRIGVVGNAAILRQPRNIRNLKAVAAGVHADYVLLGQLQAATPGLRFITHFIRLSDETHLRANRINMPDGDVSTLETSVVAEFERAVNEHVLRAGSAADPASSGAPATR